MKETILKEETDLRVDVAMVLQSHGVDFEISHHITDELFSSFTIRK